MTTLALAELIIWTMVNSYPRQSPNITRQKKTKNTYLSLFFCLLTLSAVVLFYSETLEWRKSWIPASQSYTFVHISPIFTIKVSTHQFPNSCSFVILLICTFIFLQPVDMSSMRCHLDRSKYKKKWADYLLSLHLWSNPTVALTPKL